MAPYGFRYQRLQRIFIVVTDACNARCRLCSYWKTPPGNEKYLLLFLLAAKFCGFASGSAGGRKR
jgi:molybdenum cofactor biosynthesis enzyme MoaA